MTWRRPIPNINEIPQGDHPGAFGARRRYDVHTGVDLYCPEETAVFAVEGGTVTSIEEFTGPDADPATPWWLPTQAVLVAGESGTVVYGEIAPLVQVGDQVNVGDPIGRVKRVLKRDKGRPTSMLHLELHARGAAASAPVWELDGDRPQTLMDPTRFLLEAE